jgi:hypothetical protein
MTKKMLSIDIEKLKESAKKRNSCGARARRKLKILERDGFRCVRCGSTKLLTIAHWNKINKRNRGVSDFKIRECRTLCVGCHYYEDNVKPKQEKIAIDRSYATAIIDTCGGYYKARKKYEYFKIVAKEAKKQRVISKIIPIMKKFGVTISIYPCKTYVSYEVTGKKNVDNLKEFVKKYGIK